MIENVFYFRFLNKSIGIRKLNHCIRKPLYDNHTLMSLVKKNETNKPSIFNTRNANKY